MKYLPPGPLARAGFFVPRPHRLLTNHRGQGGARVEERFPVSGGWLTCRQTGDRAELTMELPGDSRGLYRGYALGPGGLVELGTLLPEGGRLRLGRSFPVAELQRRGCWPVTGGRVQMTYAFSGARPQSLPGGWRRVERPETLFPEDETLARAARQAGGCIRCRRETGEFLLAWPWDPGHPFPLAPLFCLARVKNLGGRAYVVFLFDEGGTPVVPPEG